MATYTLTCAGFRGQKLPRETTSTTEDTYTVVLPATVGANQFNLQIQPSTSGVLYFDGTAAGQTQTNGWPIAAGGTLTIPVGNGTKFYLSAVTSGTVDFLVL